MMKLPRALLLMSAAACCSAPAFAALGGDASSVESDRAAVQGVLQVTPFLEYDMHVIRTAAGTVIHEYVSPQGKVFAVTWHGAGRPDLGQLLGSYSAKLAQAAPRTHYDHHHLRIATADVVLESDFHLRAHSGRAWVPALLPQSFASDNIE